MPYTASLGRLTIDTGNDQLIVGITTDGFMLQSTTYDPRRVFYCRYLATIVDELLSWQKMPGLSEAVMAELGGASAVEVDRVKYLEHRQKNLNSKQGRS